MGVPSVTRSSGSQGTTHLWWNVMGLQACEFPVLLSSNQKPPVALYYLRCQLLLPGSTRQGEVWEGEAGWRIWDFAFSTQFSHNVYGCSAWNVASAPSQPAVIPTPPPLLPLLKLGRGGGGGAIVDLHVCGFVFFPGDGSRSVLPPLLAQICRFGCLNAQISWTCLFVNQGIFYWIIVVWL